MTSIKQIFSNVKHETRHHMGLEAKRFRSGQPFDDDKLLSFLTRGKYKANDRLNLVNCALQSIGPNTPHLKAAEIVRRATELLQEDEAVQFMGAPRQAGFLLSYAIDRIFNAAEAMNRPINAREQQEVATCALRWLEAAPVQNSFNLNGVMHNRDELRQVANGHANLPQRQGITTQNGASPNVEALRAENAQILQSTTVVGQSVHRNVVRQAGSLIVDNLKARCASAPKLAAHETAREVSYAITRSSFPRKRSALAGLNAVIHNRSRDNNWDQEITPRQTLKLMWSYIRSLSDSSLKQNLTDSLISRLDEINRESPCVVGVLQRLLDVPTGVDSSLDVFARPAELKERVMQEAAHANEYFQGSVVDEIEAYAKANNIDETVYRDFLVELGQEIIDRNVSTKLTADGQIQRQEIEAPLQSAKEGVQYLI